MDGWENFFLGQLGASAALGGLLFVAISINLERIMAAPELPNRAMLALLLLLVVLVISALMLIPRQPLPLAGGEALVLGGILLFAGTAIEVSIGRAPRDRNRATYLFNVALFAVSALPYVIGGILLLLGDDAGLYWVAAAIIFSVVKAVLDAWVLLVEIQR
jgi:hypothetical protein